MWLQEILYVSWPNKVGRLYVSVATWIYRMEPDARLPNTASPYRMLFGREPRTRLDHLSPTLDNSGPMENLEGTVEDKRCLIDATLRILRLRVGRYATSASSTRSSEPRPESATKS